MNLISKFEHVLEDNLIESKLEYDSNCIISQGGFSIIYKGSYKGTTVAIKRLFDPSNSDDNKEEFLNEIRTL